MHRRFAFFPLVMFLCFFFVVARGQQTTPVVPDAPPPHPFATVRGVVLDPAGDRMPGAIVTLLEQSGEPERRLTTTTDAAGRFVVEGVAAGAFTMTVSSPEFAAQQISGSLAPGESRELPAITLPIAIAASQVEVTLSRKELAEYEVKLEEKQRVFGIIPNFYVSYVAHPAPLTSRQKFNLAYRTLIDPATFVGTGLAAGAQQAQGFFKGYGNGAAGYGKRYAANYGDGLTGTLIGNAILPSLLHQDPRYYYKGTGTTRSRLLYAVASSVRCKGDNGKWQPEYSGLLGALASGGLSNLYYPKSDRNGVALTFENFGFGILGGSVANVFQEFLVKKLTPRLPADSPPTP